MAFGLGRCEDLGDEGGAFLAREGRELIFAKLRPVVKPPRARRHPASPPQYLDMLIVGRECARPAEQDGLPAPSFVTSQARSTLGSEEDRLTGSKAGSFSTVRACSEPFTYARDGLLRRPHNDAPYIVC